MSNEITVRITCSLQEMYNILQNKGFKITDKYNLEDTYYIKEDIDIKKQPIKEIFNKYILIRNITQFRPDNFVDSYNILKMTLKIKNIESDGTKDNPELNSIDKLKEKISELQIPVDTNDYFIKKAEIELKKFL